MGLNSIRRNIFLLVLTFVVLTTLISFVYGDTQDYNVTFANLSSLNLTVNLSSNATYQINVTNEVDDNRSYNMSVSTGLLNISQLNLTNNASEVILLTVWNYTTPTSILSIIYATVADNASIVTNSSYDIGDIQTTVTDETDPNIELNLPVDGANSTSQLVSFNCFVSDNVNLSNVSLYGNWSGGWHVNSTNSSGVSGVNYTFDVSVADGVYVWNCYACDNSSNCGWNDSNRTLRVDTAGPGFSNIDNSTTTNQSAVITWNTTESANSSLIWGVNESMSLSSNGSSSLSTGHSLAIYGLSNNTLYFFNVTGCDVYGNCNSSGPHNFTTLNPDVTAPVISNVSNFSITNVSVVVGWSTDEVANSSLVWGVNDSLSGGSNQSAAFGTWRTFEVYNLTNNTLYYYNVTSCDGVGLCTTEGPFNFTTTNPDLLDPYVELVSPVDGFNDTNGAVDLSCYVYDNINVSNVTFYGNWSGGWHANSTNSSGQSGVNYTLGISLSDASYVWNCYACDNASNCAWNGSNRTFTIDTVPPEISSVANVSTTNQSTLINWTTDTSANSSIVWGVNDSLSGGSNVSASFVTGHSLAVYNLSNGTLYFFNVTSCDFVGWCNTSGPYNFTTASPDVTAPVISNVSNFSITNVSVVVGWNTDEVANSSLKYGTDLGMSGGTVENSSLVSWRTFVLSGLNDNTAYFFNVTSCDGVGLCTTEGPFNFSTLDTDYVDPYVELVSPVDGYNSSTFSVGLTCFVSDETAVSNVTFFGNWSDGWHANSTNSSGVGGVNYSLSLSSGEGNYVWNCYACDTSGNCAWNGSNRTFRVDATYPGVSSVINVSTTNVSTLINWSTDEVANSSLVWGVNDSLSGGSNVSASFVTGHSLAVYNLSNGTLYFFNVTSCDFVGWCNTSGPYNFTTASPDVTAPVISNVSNFSITNVSVVVGWNTDEVANSSLKYGTDLGMSGGTVENSSLVSWRTFVLSGLNDNTAYFFNVTSCDGVGLCTTEGPFNFTTTNPDLTDPIVELNLPVDGANSMSQLVSFDCFVSDNVNLSNVSLYGNWSGGWHVNSTNSSGVSGVNYTFDVSVADGVYVWNCYACDNSSNCGWNDSNRTLRVDTTGPGFSNIDNSTTTNQSAVITWNTTESANSSIVWGVNDSLSGGSNVSASFVTGHSLAIYGLTNNTLYFFNVTGCDMYGNCNSSGPHNFTTANPDVTAPTISNVTHASTTNMSSAITWTTNENANASLAWGINTSLTGGQNQTSSINTTHSLLIYNLTNNTLYYYNVTSCDVYGNCNSSGPHNFTTTNLDISAPSITNVSNYSIMNVSAIVGWNTDESANASIVYGINLSMTSGSNQSASLATWRYFHISGLTNSTLYYYNVTSCDASGNCDTSGPYNFTTLDNDITAPYVSLESPINGYNSSLAAVDMICYVKDSTAISNVTLYGNWSENWSAISVNSSGNNATNYTFSVSMNDGSHKWNCYACDTWGNCAWNSSNRTFTVDATRPQLNITHPRNGTTFYNGTVYLNWTVNDTNLANVTYKLDSNSSVFGNTSNYTILNNLLAGKHKINMSANDTYGNTVNDVVYFTIDKPVNISKYVADLVSANARAFEFIVYDALNGTNYTDETNLTLNSTNISITFQVNYTNQTNKTGNIVSVNSFPGLSATWSELFSVQTENSALEASITNSGWSPWMVLTVENMSNFIQNSSDYFVNVSVNITGVNFTYVEYCGGTSSTSCRFIDNCTNNNFTGVDDLECFTLHGAPYERMNIYAYSFSSVVISLDNLTATANVSAPINATNYTSGSDIYLNFTVDETVNGTYSVDGSSNLSISETTDFSSQLNGTLNSTQLDYGIFANGEHNVTVWLWDNMSNSDSFIVYFNVSDYTAPTISALNVTDTSSSSSSGTATIHIYTDEYTYCWYNQSDTNLNASSSNLSAYSQTDDGLSKHHTISHAYSSSGTVAGYHVTCADVLQHNMTYANFTGNFSVSVTTYTGSPGGGGGGGSSPSTQPTTEPISPSNWGEQAVLYWDFIATQERSSRNVDSDIISVSKVILNAAQTVTYGSVKVVQLTSPPAVSQVFIHDSYQYLTLLATNISASQISDISIEFKVSKFWIKNNNPVLDSIKLFRYTTDWDELTTKQIREDDEYVYFSAVSPGFSYFAVGVKEFQPIEVLENCPETCDDGQACTIDRCSEETGFECVHETIEPCCGNQVCEEGEDYVICDLDCPAPFCPDSCDDGNECTNDICSDETDFKCANQPIVPCCGNGDCEAEEDWKNCSEDCKKPVALPWFHIIISILMVLIIVAVVYYKYKWKPNYHRRLSAKHYANSIAKAHSAAHSEEDESHRVEEQNPEGSQYEQQTSSEIHAEHTRHERIDNSENLREPHHDNEGDGEAGPLRKEFERQG